VPDFGQLLSALGNASGWVVALALAISVIVALIRGDLVPGYLHRVVQAKLDDATSQLATVPRTTEQAADAAHAATDLALGLAKELVAIQSAARDSSREAP
jgi:hypothetical protein